MDLDLQQSGIFTRPGQVACGLRLIVGLLILFAIRPLVTALRPDGVLSIDYWPIWIALASAFWLVNDVVNIGLGRNFGWRPRFGLVGFLALGLYLVCSRMDG